MHLTGDWAFASKNPTAGIDLLMFACLQVTTQRQKASVAATRKTNITFEYSPTSMYVCPRHFHGGKWYKILNTSKSVNFWCYAHNINLFCLPRPFFIFYFILFFIFREPPTVTVQENEVNQLTEEKDMHTCDKSWSSSHIWLFWDFRPDENSTLW